MPQTKVRLTFSKKLQVDISKQFGVEQSAMPGAGGIVYAKALA